MVELKETNSKKKGSCVLRPKPIKPAKHPFRRMPSWGLPRRWREFFSTARNLHTPHPHTASCRACSASTRQAGLSADQRVSAVFFRQATQLLHRLSEQSHMNEVERLIERTDSSDFLERGLSACSCRLRHSACQTHTGTCTPSASIRHQHAVDGTLSGRLAEKRTLET